MENASFFIIFLEELVQKVQQINRRQAKSLISSAKNLMKARIENILKNIKKS